MASAEMRGLIASFGYALAGLGAVLLRERNGRIHLAVALRWWSPGLGLGVGARGLALARGRDRLVWIAEAVNTALETLCDTLHPDRAEGIGRTKDLAAGAVLVAALAAVLIGMLVFWPYVFG